MQILNQALLRSTVFLGGKWVAADSGETLAVHDPATGQNYWAEAGRDWRENGPRGPGYYAHVNGEDIRVDGATLS